MLISGSGSTMQAIAKACLFGELKNKITPVVVISSRKDAKGIQKALDLKIPVFIIQPKEKNFGSKIARILKNKKVNFVLQNGWLPFTPKAVVSKYEHKIFNQHPGPLDPGSLDKNRKALHFGGKGMHGLAVHQAVLKFQELTGRRFPTEAAIHKVTPIVDGGAVVYRKKVPVFKNDTAESLAARVLPIEHKIQIEFLKKLFQGQVKNLKRKKPLVMPGEEKFLHQAIEFARKKYPNG